MGPGSTFSTQLDAEVAALKGMLYNGLLIYYPLFFGKVKGRWGGVSEAELKGFVLREDKILSTSSICFIHKTLLLAIYKISVEAVNRCTMPSCNLMHHVHKQPNFVYVMMMHNKEDAFVLNPSPQQLLQLLHLFSLGYLAGSRYQV